MTSLNVWMNGELVGGWSVERGGAHVFRYEQSWLDSPNVRALSVSLPITQVREVRGPVVESWFDNLLPDSRPIRERVRMRFGIKSGRAFDLLAAIGRDCVGAVQLLPPDREPTGFDRIDSTPITGSEIERLLQGLTARPDPEAEDLDDFRISIAGAQEKTALLRIGKKWHRPRGATPSTHILKLPLGLIGGRRFDMSDSVENEWLCAQIVEALGLPVASTEMAVFGRQKVLVVERFDRRRIDKTWIARLPQEDLCQATATPADRKYERDGGPGMRQCLTLLGASKAPDQDRATFVLAQLAFWLLAATDGHAKNFSIVHTPGHSYALTPLYDIISMWPMIGAGVNRIAPQDARLAMALRAKNAHYRLKDIQTRHWRQLAATCGVPAVWDAMQALVERVEDALNQAEKCLPPDFPEPLWKKIAKGMRGQVAVFRAGLDKV